MKINPLVINYTFLILGWLTFYGVCHIFGENGMAFLLVAGVGSLILLILYLTRTVEK